MKQHETTRRLLAIDPSLTASGWALFSLDRFQPLALGIISPPGPAMPLVNRLEILQRDVKTMMTQFGLGRNDLLVCEGPAPLVLNPSSALKVERVRGIFEAVSRELQIVVPGRINPRTVQTELLGMRGQQIPRPQVKAWARETVQRLFGAQLVDLPVSGLKSRKAALPQDIIDALLIGFLAVSKVRLSLKTGVSLESAFESSVKRTRFSSEGRRCHGWTEDHVQKLRAGR